MRKYLIFMIMFFVFSYSFSKNINFIFNVTTGNIFYSTNNDKQFSKYFYDGQASLDLEENKYFFTFSTEGYPDIKREIDVNEINSPINIGFERNNFVTIHGKVKNKDTNIGNFSFSFVDSKNVGHIVTTDMYGDYSIMLPRGKYTINTSNKGYLISEISQGVKDFYSGKDDIPYNIYLDEPMSKIEGQVVDEEGDAIPFPKISYKLNNSIQTGTGDEFGRFSINMNPGVITILGQKEGYFQNGIVRNIPQNSSISNLEIRLTRMRANINGVVTDGVRPLRNVQVYLLNNDYEKISSTKTDINGFFEFYKIPTRDNVFLAIFKGNKIIKKSKNFNIKEDNLNMHLILDDEDKK